MSSCLTPVIQQRKQWNNTQKSGVQVLLTARGDFFTAFLFGLIPKAKWRDARSNEIGLSAGRRRVQSARTTVPLLATVLHVALRFQFWRNTDLGSLMGNSAMVARSTWDGEVAGSSPVFPTEKHFTRLKTLKKRFIIGGYDGRREKFLP